MLRIALDQSVPVYRMVNTRANPGTEEDEIRGMIVEEVTRVITDTIPELFTGIRDQLGAMIDERLAAFAANGGGQQRGFTYRDFSACSPPEFKGEADPMAAMRWISDVEGVFRTSGCPENLRVRYALNLLRGPAKDWWGLHAASLTVAQVDALVWDEFVTRFRQQYVPRVEVERITREFLALEQRDESVTEITIKFREMALFCPEYTATEEMKMTRYLSMLRDDIREFVSAVGRNSLAEMIEAARRREIELELQGKKRKTFQAPIVGASLIKKPRMFDAKTKHRNGGSKPLNGAGRAPLTCFKCGHYAKDCKSDLKICYNCGQLGHIKSDCPKLKIGGGNGAVRNPAPATLQITDGRAGQTGNGGARGRAYQLTADEAREAPRVVTGMCVSVAFYFLLIIGV